jgi:hypothetical protein
VCAASHGTIMTSIGPSFAGRCYILTYRIVLFHSEGEQQRSKRLNCDEEMIKRCTKESDNTTVKNTTNIGTSEIDADESYTSL